VELSHPANKFRRCLCFPERNLLTQALVFVSYSTRQNLQKSHGLNLSQCKVSRTHVCSGKNGIGVTYARVLTAASLCRVVLNHGGICSFNAGRRADKACIRDPLVIWDPVLTQGIASHRYSDLGSCERNRWKNQRGLRMIGVFQWSCLSHGGQVNPERFQSPGMCSQLNEAIVRQDINSAPTKMIYT